MDKFIRCLDELDVFLMELMNDLAIDFLVVGCDELVLVDELGDLVSQGLIAEIFVDIFESKKLWESCYCPK